MYARCPLCQQRLSTFTAAEVGIEDAARVLNVRESSVEMLLEKGELLHRSIRLTRGGFEIVLIPLYELVKLKEESMAKMDAVLEELADMDPDPVDPG